MEKLLTKADLKSYFRIGMVKVTQIIKQPDFPQPIKLTENSRKKIWRESDIVKWMETK